MIFYRQDGPSSGGTPAASSAPAPADSASQAAPASATPGAPQTVTPPDANAPTDAAPGGFPTQLPPTGPDAQAAPAPDPSQERVSAAQRLMHQATTARADLEKKLGAIMGDPAIGTRAREIVGTPPATMQPGAQPTPPQAAPQPGAQPATSPAQNMAGFTVRPERRAEIFKKYSEAANNEEAVGILMEETAKEMAPAIVSQALQVLFTHPQAQQMLVENFMGHLTGMQRTTAAKGEIEGYWKSVAPEIPTRVIWAYGQEAERVHPGNIPQQAQWMLEQAIREMEPMLNRVAQNVQTNTNIQRGQDAGLPSSGPGPAPRTPDTPSTFTSQLRTLRAKQMGT